ncbi:MAG: hypothetical protein IPF64_01700 [Flavobacteriales bacterium]|nr:hypothetical protein [Flavobacteriales bacterium]
MGEALVSPARNVIPSPTLIDNHGFNIYPVLHHIVLRDGLRAYTPTAQTQNALDFDGVNDR